MGGGEGMHVIVWLVLPWMGDDERHGYDVTARTCEGGRGRAHEVGRVTGNDLYPACVGNPQQSFDQHTATHKAPSLCPFPLTCQPNINEPIEQATIVCTNARGWGRLHSAISDGRMASSTRISVCPGRTAGSTVVDASSTSPPVNDGALPAASAAAAMRLPGGVFRRILSSRLYLWWKTSGVDVGSRMAYG